MRISCYFSLMTIGVVAACGSPPPPPVQPPPEPVAVDPSICELGKRARAVWNEEVRDSLDLSVKIVEDIIEAWEAESFTHQMDAFVSSWTQESESACKKHYFDNATPEDAYLRQADCFERQLEESRQIIELMSSGDPAAVDRSAALSDALGNCL